MARSYPKFRRAQREGGPFRRGRAARAPASSALFIAQLTIGMLIVGGLTWQLTPRLLAASPSADAPRDAPARVERSVYYPRCAAARAAGVAPIYRGAPGYREGLDSDGDGVACEPHQIP